MAEKDQEALPVSTASGLANRDEEAAMAQSKELRRRKRIKIAAYIAIFIVFQTLVLVVFDLTILRVRRPKYRIRSITIENLSVRNATNSPSFNMRFNADVTVKNRNFGPYKFQNNYMTFSYRGTPVGEALITASSAGILSTKKMSVTLSATSNAVSTDSDLDSDIALGMLTLTSNSKMRGQVELMKILKKDKSSIMDCTMTVNLSDKIVQDLRCD